MNETQPTTSISAAWDRLADHLEGFLQAWEEGAEPPTLRDFLPSEPAAVRRLALVELIKIDLEYRGRGAGARLTLEHYLEEFPELLAEEGPPLDLVYEEFHVRRAAGEQPTPQEYFRRFPHLEGPLGRMLAVEQPPVTSSLFGRGGRPEFNAGEQIDDFELRAELGRGAFATVFHARQVSLERDVALKISADKGMETQTLAQLDHPNIVRVFDQRRLPERRLKLLYMELVPGGTLHDVIAAARPTPLSARDGRLLLAAIDATLHAAGRPPSDAYDLRGRIARTRWPELVCRLGAQLAEALDYAHRRGVLHRDIKPANVLLTAEGAPKLADFNISFSNRVEGASAATYFGGSLAYMSPEQLEVCHPRHPRQAEELDQRTDIYSLGVLLWELLYGRRPYPDLPLEDSWSETVAALTQQRRAALPEAPQPPEGPVHADLHNVLLRCLEPKLEQRISSGAELARTLLLCTQPEARRLMDTPHRGWGRFLARHPFIGPVAGALLPNLAAAPLNFFYNRDEIVDPAGWAAFWNFRNVFDSIAFPLATILGLLLLFPVLRTVFRAARGMDCTPAELTSARRHSLWLGQWLAGMGIVFWTLAGVIYPIGLTQLEIPTQPYAFPHFLLSMILSGLIAVSYPFLIVTLVSVRVYYPLLSPRTPDSATDRPAMQRLSRWAGLHLLAAGGVPLIAVATLSFLELAGLPNANRAIPAAICLAGIAGLALAFWMYRLLLRSLELLQQVHSASSRFQDAREPSGEFSG